MGKTNNQQQNGRIKFTHNNINIKYKWTKCHNQKTQTGKLGKKSKPISVLLSGDPSHMQTHVDSKKKGQKKIYQANGGQKIARVAISVTDKIDFKPTKIRRDKEGRYLMVKGSIHQEELTILNTRNTGAPRYIKQVLNDLQRDLDSCTIIVGVLNTPLSTLDR